MSCSVYVLRTPAGQPSKIGISTHPRSRLAQIRGERQGERRDASLAFIVQCDCRQSALRVEAKAHSLLKPKHERGDWFNVTTQDAIRAVVSAAESLEIKIVQDADGRDSGHLLQMRMSKEFFSMVDDWRRERRPIPNRSEAVRMMIESVLGHPPPRQDRHQTG